MHTIEAEFRGIYEAHFEYVWRSLSRLGVHDADLPDAAQKVFVTAYRKLPGFEQRSSIARWLFGIARRVASDYRRSAAVRREITLDPSVLETVNDSTRPDFEQHESARALLAQQILDKLPEPQRTVLVLAEVEELEGAQIAELLGIPMGTVRSRLRLARKFFQREVKRLAVSSRKK